MAQATFSVRMDKKLKNQFSDICNSIGMNMSTAINIFANAVVDTKKIPFEVKAPSSYKEKYYNAITSMRKTAKENGASNLSLREINSIIKKTRNSNSKQS